MKKLFLLLALPIFALSGCGNKTSVVPEEKREKITLTAENYSKYIAVYTDLEAIHDNYYVTWYYRYQLVGSNLCKFNDCEITYEYVNQQGQASDITRKTINLTISGCGETEEVSFNSRIDKSVAYYIFNVVSASGTVEVLY